MPNIEALPESAISDPQILAAIRRTELAGAPGVWFIRLVARAPEHGKAVLQMLEVVNEQGSLPRRLKLLVRFILARLTDDAYFGDGLRTQLSETENVSAEFLEKLLGDYEETSRIDEQERIALRFAVLAFVDKSQIDDAFYDSLHKHFTEKQIIELVTLVSLNYAVHLIMSTLAPPADCRPTDSPNRD